MVMVPAGFTTLCMYQRESILNSQGICSVWKGRRDTHQTGSLPFNMPRTEPCGSADFNPLLAMTHDQRTPPEQSCICPASALTRLVFLPRPLADSPSQTWHDHDNLLSWCPGCHRWPQGCIGLENGGLLMITLAKGLRLQAFYSFLQTPLFINSVNLSTLITCKSVFSTFGHHMPVTVSNIKPDLHPRGCACSGGASSVGGGAE